MSEDKKCDYPKILIISNQCLSMDSSNGRTLLNFLLNWPKELIYQFYTSEEDCSYLSNNNILRITDSNCVTDFIQKRKSDTNTILMNKKNISKNSISKLAREVVWKINYKALKRLYKWTEEIEPEVIIFQAGDNGFLCRIARKVSYKFNIPLIIYNSEDYYFKNYDYFKEKGLKKVFYPLFHISFKKDFERLIKVASFSIYNSEYLEIAYKSKFGKMSDFIYTSTQIGCNKNENNDIENPKISYLGNLDLGRHLKLLDLADCLKEINPEYKLSIYGKAKDDSVVKMLNSHSNIDFKGFVSYDDVLKIISDSDLLIHIENDDKFSRRDLKYAFSTKIADSLASGVPFLVYTSKEYPFAKYLIKNNAAFVVESKKELLKEMGNILNNPIYRVSKLNNAHSLVERNHNFKKNCEKFENIIFQILKEKNNESKK